MSCSKDFHIVQKHDTLSEIAKRYGTTEDQLCKINGIKNRHLIKEGQIIALKAKAICKVTVLVLDRDHNPIQGAKIRLDYNGKSKVFSSGACGIIPSIITQTPDDIVKIYIRCEDGTWKKLKDATSGWGNKRVTIKSPKTKHEGETMPHPKDPSGKPVRDPKHDKKPVSPPANPEKTEKKSERKNDKNGLPVQKETVDQVKLDFLKGYTGEKISEDDYMSAAKNIGCEVAVIKAVAEVETRKEAFDKKNRPTILYERHKFSKYCTPPGKYNKSNPDISSITSKRYKKASPENKKLVLMGKLKQYDLYADSYPRLAKAYSLDKNAALQACSWGKFQIMGFNYKECGYKTALSYVEDMCISEKKHLKAFVSFVKSNKKLRNAVIKKDWATFAYNYNGEDYKDNKYDTKMAEAYKRHAK